MGGAFGGKQSQNLAGQISLFVGSTDDSIRRNERGAPVSARLRPPLRRDCRPPKYLKFLIGLRHTGDRGNPWAAIRISAGPETAFVPMMGLIATTGALVCFKASTMPGTARIGPMLVTGLLGARSTTVAERMASMTPGAGSDLSTPAKRTELTGS